VKKQPPQLEGRIVLFKDAPHVEHLKRADTTGIALQLVGTVFVFGLLCAFGWHALLLVVPIMLLGRLL
jgi:hypothetical protein